MLQRKALHRIKAWHQAHHRTALLIDGARQVGKTYLVRAFAQENYQHVVELNFIENPELVQIFSTPRDAKSILMRMELVAQTPMVPGKTLVFLDEVQQVPELATAIKFLVDDGRFDFILSGSLLGVELEDIRSVPAGYLTEMTMFPLDFEEFCWAHHIGSDVFDMLSEAFRTLSPIDSFIHQRLMELFSRYLVIGGMPAAVDTFLASDSIAQTRAVQEDITKAYRRDISQYAAKEDRLHIRSIYDLIPSELNNPNKRFTFAKLEQGMRFQALARDFDWLTAVNVAICATNVEEPTVPLKASAQRNLFKLFSSDIGLLTGSYLNSTALALLDGKTDINYGGIYENAVAQELTAHGFDDLHYYNSKKYGELDLLVQDRNDRIIVLEVKSGKDYHRHRALDNILDVPNYQLDRGYVLGPGNVEVKKPVVYLPIYMAGQFVNE